MPNTNVSTLRKEFIHLTADTGKFVRPSAHAHVKLLHSVDQVRDVPLVLEIGFGPPSADFGSIWASQKARKF